MATQDFITDRTVLVTGANRGLGSALVEEALRRGARRVYAGSRQAFAHTDPRVVPLALDITDEDAIDAAARAVEELDVLVNNAGFASYAPLEDRAALQRHLAVNLYGPYQMTYAFWNHLVEARGTLVNVLSLASLVTAPVTPAYSISKAAAFSLTQTLRILFADQGVRVHAVLAGPLDTDMARGIDIPKTAPACAAAAIFDGIAAGDEEIFPDPASAAAFAEDWPTGAVKTLERRNTELLLGTR